jgi:hypothetical protein
MALPGGREPLHDFHEELAMFGLMALVLVVSLAFLFSADRSGWLHRARARSAGVEVAARATTVPRGIEE